MDKVVHVHELNSIDRLFLGQDETKGELQEEQRQIKQNNLLNLSSINSTSSTLGTKDSVISYFHVG